MNHANRPDTHPCQQQLSRRSMLKATVGAAWTVPVLRARRATAREIRLERGPFRVRAITRRYDLHRPKGCTVLAIEYADWPGNEFGLWLPETLFADGKVVWANWLESPLQDWNIGADAELQWNCSLDAFTFSSTLRVEPSQGCLWYRHSFTNTSNDVLKNLNSQTCFHLVNAPQFISLAGSRYWANLDGKWTTTDKVPRDKSPDPRRVVFWKQGLREERSVQPLPGFARAIMPQAAHHSLFIAENFAGTASVGIATRNLHHLFNNNDSILRCLHSESMPIAELPPKETAHQDSVIVFHQGDHRSLLDHFDTMITPEWPEPG